MGSLTSTKTIIIVLKCYGDWIVIDGSFQLKMIVEQSKHDFFLIRGAPSNQNCLLTFSDQFHSVEVPSFSIMLIKLKVL